MSKQEKGGENTHVWIVAANHLTVRDLMAQAIGRFVGIDGHVEHVTWMSDSRQAGQVHHAVYSYNFTIYPTVSCNKNIFLLLLIVINNYFILKNSDPFKTFVGTNVFNQRMCY